MEKTLRSFYGGSNADLGPVNMDSPPQINDYLRWTGAYWAPASFEEPEKNLTETVRNAGFTMLPKGTPVKIVGNTGQEANVIAANATDSFPAHLVLNQDLLAGASGEAVAIGFINNVSVPNASIFTGGQEVYLGPTGGWTTTRPTGTNKIQKLGTIVKPNTGANTVSGIINIANIQDLPNLSEGKIWIGGSDAVPQESDLVFSGQIINGVAHFIETTAPAFRKNAAGQNIGPLVYGDRWYKPTDNNIPGTAGGWIWTGSDWASVNVFPLSIPFVNGSSNNQTIRSESAGTNLGIIVSGLATQIAVLNANPTSANYWTAAISVSGTPITTLSTQNAISYPHNYSTPNTVIPARADIPVGGQLTATALGQTTRNWYGMTSLGTDVYACVSGGDIYKQTNGIGNFLPLGQTSRSWTGMTTLGTDVYACVQSGDIYKQTNGTGNFVALSQTSRNWYGMATLGTDVYACVFGGDIYKQTNGTGDFLPLGQTTRSWLGMTTLGTDVYACVYSGDIYKQTNGTGDFIALGQTSRTWWGMTKLGTDVYACVNVGDIYKQTNGTGDFIALGQTSRSWTGMTTLGTDVYACVQSGDIYRLTAGGVTSIGHSLEVTLTRTGAVSLPYVSITANCQVIHP